jgi:maleylpyruvate isomerase
MTRTLEDSLAWAARGDELVLKATAGLTDDDLRAPSTLPGWSVGNLVAHVAANADALLNLVTWAMTGVETPMYASPDERAEGIAKGDKISAAEAKAWLGASTARLAEGFASLTDAEWAHEVRTAQGRTVPATVVPFLRSREGMVHAVDLDRGVTFADLPESFLDALIEDILAKRGNVTDLPAGPKPDLAAWLAGRPNNLAGAPPLGPWL